MTKTGKASCSYCPGTDRESIETYYIQTVSYAVCQGWFVFPAGGVPRGYWRGRCGWWSEFS